MGGKPIVIGLIVCAGLLVSGCCGCCIPTEPVPPNTPGDSYPGQASGSDLDSDLVGGWGDVGTMGDIVDSAGNFVGDAYSGQNYRFNRDGTYRYRIIASGVALSGLCEVTGKYRVGGGKLYLSDKKESFYPAAGERTPPSRDVPGTDETFVYWIEDEGDTLALMYEESGYTERFHRVE